MSLIKAGVSLKMELPRIKLTVNKAKRIARIKIIKSRLIDKEFCGIKILDVDLYMSKQDRMDGEFHFIVEYDNEKLTREIYQEFLTKVTEIIDAIQTNFKV